MSFGIEAAAYYLAEQRRDIHHWGRIAAKDDALIDRMHRNGVWHYHCAEDLSVMDMALRAVQRLFDTCGTEPHSIDLVIYTHSLPTSVPPAPLSAPQLIKSRFGLANAECFSIAQQNCMSSLMAFRVARSLMAVRPSLRTALIVAADKILEEEYRNIQDAGIMSDGAAACIVKRGCRRNAIRGISISTNGRFHAGPDTSPEVSGMLMQTYGLNACKILNRAIEQSGVGRDAYDVLLPMNARVALVSNVVRLMKLSPNLPYGRNVALKGHALCADGIINFVDLLEEARPWRNLIIYATGSNGCFGAATMQNLQASACRGEVDPVRRSRTCANTGTAALPA